MPATAETLAFETSPGRIALVGALTFASVEATGDDAGRVLSAQQQGRVDVDLQRVERADSAGLALLVGWIAAARAAQVTLAFHGMPERLRAIARICEVDALLAEGGAA
jgi:phospholipid transport system transporter-binding protein